MNKKSQSGFGVVEVLLVLVIVGIIGFTGWRVYEANREVSNAPVDDSIIEKKPISTVPKGWKIYENNDLGFSFAYPEAWGDVQKDDAINEGSKTYEGGHYYFTFSKYELFNVAAKTADYKYTGLGMGAPSVNGFTNFDEKYQDILKYEQNLEGYHGDIVEKSANSIVYTTASGYSGDILARGIAKTTKLPGLDFAFAIPVSTLKLSDDTVSKLFEGKISAKQHLSQEQINTVVTFAKNVKSL